MRLWPGQRIEVGSARLELHRRLTPAETGVTLPPAEAALQRLLPADFRSPHKYEVGGVVAQGGMGAILDAREAALRRTVAMTSDAGSTRRGRRGAVRRGGVGDGTARAPEHRARPRAERG
jgi:hypothetical protein